MPRGLHTAPAALACVVILSWFPMSAQAFELFGMRFFEDEAAIAADAVVADPQPYSVNFSITGLGAHTEDALKGASSLWNGRDTPASGSAGLLATARGDYQRLTAALFARGHYGGVVRISVDGREAEAIAPDADLPDPVHVVIRIDTGPLFTFGDISFANGAPEGIAALGLAPGEPAKSGAIRAGARLAVNRLRAQGYPKAEISMQDITASHRTNTVDVALGVSPGPKAVFGEVTVQGAEDVDSAFIARQAGLEPGRLYSPAEVEKARERLIDLDVFQSVKIEEGDAVTPDGRLPMRIVVAERLPRRIGAGASFSTTDGLGVEGFWLHRNLLGQAERLRLDARIAGIGYPVNTAAFDYYFGGTFTKPGVITPDTDLLAEAIAERNVLPRYTELSVEGRLGLSHEFSPEWMVTGGVVASRSNYNDAVYGTRDFTIAGLYGDVTFDSRDDATDATEGFYASLSVEPFYEFNYDNLAVLAVAEARAYFSFDPEDRFVLAARAKIGGLLGPALSEVPPDKLFFAGGGGSVRGYSYRSIGVDIGGGTITGGKFLTEASIEGRVKVSDDIGVVGFVDAGYVTANGFVGLAAGTRIGVGAGVRYYTGFGPLRLDFAIPLNKRAGDPDYALYVGIGQAF